jgi:transposase
MAVTCSCSEASGDLLKVLWADGIGVSLCIKRLERGRFIWPTPVGGLDFGDIGTFGGSSAVAGRRGAPID